MYLFLYFLNFILNIFLEDHIGNKCAIVCFNVSILGKYYIYMYYTVLPNKLTHSQKRVGKPVDLLYMLCRGCGKSFVVCSFCVFT